MDPPSAPDYAIAVSAASVSVGGSLTIQAETPFTSTIGFLNLPAGLQLVQSTAPGSACGMLYCYYLGGPNSFTAGAYQSYPIKSRAILPQVFTALMS